MGGQNVWVCIGKACILLVSGEVRSLVMLVGGGAGWWWCWMVVMLVGGATGWWGGWLVVRFDNW